MSKDKNQWIRFISGGLASSTAEIITLPIDCTKVRLQAQGMMTHKSATTPPSPVKYNGMLHAMFTISKTEGPATLWNGLTPALLRQVSYSGMAMQLYEPVKHTIHSLSNNGNDTEDSQPSFGMKLLAGGTAGALSLALVNPLDVIKVRMQSGTASYSSVLDAIRCIINREGIVSGLTRGLGPNIQRGFIVNAAELGTYDHIKSVFVESFPSANVIYSHFAASVVAGFAGAVASNPVDVVKTRLMAQPVSTTELLYRNTLDCAVKTVKAEGWTALYKGFIPNWMRKGPWCVIFFLSYEQFHDSITRNISTESKDY